MSNNFDQYQKKTRETAVYPIASAIEYTALGLSSEAGEVAGTVKKYLRRDFDKIELSNRLEAELGDVLWYAARLADELNLDLAGIARLNLEKLEDRKARNVIKGDGDNR